MSHNPGFMEQLPEIYRRTVWSITANQMYLWVDRVKAANQDATPDERAEWKRLCDAQDGLIKAMVIHQEAGGARATWGFYYGLLGYCDDHLTEVEKNTLVTETI